MKSVPKPRRFWTPRRKVAVERQARQLVCAGMTGEALALLLEAQTDQLHRREVTDVPAPALSGGAT